MHAILVERVQVRARDGSVGTLVAFDDVVDDSTTRLFMLATGEGCAAIDQNSWRADVSGLVFRRVSPEKDDRKDPVRLELRRRVRRSVRQLWTATRESRDLVRESRETLRRVRNFSEPAESRGCSVRCAHPHS